MNTMHHRNRRNLLVVMVAHRLLAMVISCHLLLVLLLGVSVIVLRLVSLRWVVRVRYCTSYAHGILSQVSAICLINGLVMVKVRRGCSMGWRGSRGAVLIIVWRDAAEILSPVHAISWASEGSGRSTEGISATNTSASQLCAVDVTAHTGGVTSNVVISVASIRLITHIESCSTCAPRR